MRGQPSVYKTLDNLAIPYEVVEHDAVFTAEEMSALPWPPDVGIAKNLFLRDAKGKHFFLVILPVDKAASLKDLGEKLGPTRLSFASEERLYQHLRLTRGAVSLFGLINNHERTVEAVIDKELSQSPRLGFHPNENTATVFIAYKNMLALLEHLGVKITMI